MREGNHVPWGLVELAHVRLRGGCRRSRGEAEEGRELRVLADPH